MSKVTQQTLADGSDGKEKLGIDQWLLVAFEMEIRTAEKTLMRSHKGPKGWRTNISELSRSGVVVRRSR